MALIESPHSKILENSKNSSEIQGQQKQESLGFIPIVHVKDVYKSFDFKNNRIIQQQVADISSTINEKEFNDFCRQQLNK